MLVWLAEHLVAFYSGFNVFSYLTFRAIVSLLTALFISLWMGPRLIAWLQKLQIGQVVRNDGPESHFSKRGTPTMGGIMILTSITISVLMWAYPSNPYVWCVLFVLIGFGIIGFVDDYRKVVRKDTKGLIARWKYFWMSVISLGVAFGLYAAGKGVPLDLVEAAKWHLLARGGGKPDPELDQMFDKLSAADSEKAQAQAKAFKPVAVTLVTSSAPPKFGPRRIK